MRISPLQRSLIGGTVRDDDIAEVHAPTEVARRAIERLRATDLDEIRARHYGRANE